MKNVQAGETHTSGSLEEQEEGLRRVTVEQVKKVSSHERVKGLHQTNVS